MSWAFAPEQDVATSLRYGHFEVELDDDGIPVALGAGAMAVTYRARDTVLNSVVALKVIGRKLADNPMARTRFLREARAAAQIHHPNVARVIHYGEQDGECFYAMELVEGETLEARVQRTGPLPVSQALEVIEQATRALAAAETCGVVHRDIKPSNVMIESDASGALLGQDHRLRRGQSSRGANRSRRSKRKSGSLARRLSRVRNNLPSRATRPSTRDPTFIR